MTRIIIATAVAALALGGPLAVHAQGKSQGKGQAHSAQAGHGKAVQAGQSSAWNPPGLAKRTERPPGLAKKPGQMPPGQMKKQTRAWAQGEALPSNYLTRRYQVPMPSGAGLEPAPYGYNWVKVGDQYYLAQEKTGLVSQVLSALAR